MARQNYFYRGLFVKKYIVLIIRIILAVLAAGCVYYSYAVYSLRTGTISYLLWIGVAVFLLLVTFLMGKERWSKIPLWFRKIAVAVLLACISLFLFTELLILSKFGARAKPGADCIIVLGAQMFEGGPGTLYKQRLDSAYDYLMANPDTVCIVTGAQGSNEPISEGRGGCEYLIKRGIDSSRVWYEEESFNTRENIENAHKIIKENFPETERIAIVTNNFHVFRGMFLAKKITGLSVEGIAAPAVAKFLPTNMLREPLGIIKDAFFVVFE